MKISEKSKLKAENALLNVLHDLYEINVHKIPEAVDYLNRISDRVDNMKKDAGQEKSKPNIQVQGIDHPFKVTFGKEGVKQSWQGDFPVSVPCAQCTNDTVPAVNFKEVFLGIQEGWIQNCVAAVHDHNENPDDRRNNLLWPHDYCAIQIYLCRHCMMASVLYNQA